MVIIDPLQYDIDPIQTITQKKNIDWTFNRVRVTPFETVKFLDENGNEIPKISETEAIFNPLPKVAIVKGSWFTLTKKSNKEIEIKVSKNEEKDDRFISFDADAGNCKQSIIIQQQGITSKYSN